MAHLLSEREKLLGGVLLLGLQLGRRRHKVVLQLLDQRLPVVVRFAKQAKHKSQEPKTRACSVKHYEELRTFECSNPHPGGMYMVDPHTHTPEHLTKAHTRNFTARFLALKRGFTLA